MAQRASLTGVLYAGLMIDALGSPKVVEFNCRLGDPETQPMMMRLKSDFAVVVDQAVNGLLDKAEIEWDRRIALGVVLAAAGYPEEPRAGDVIEGLLKPTEEVHVFHAGTVLDNGKLVSSGGRVLCVTALGDNVKIARQKAYQAADVMRFSGCQMRRDIGWRALGARK